MVSFYITFFITLLLILIRVPIAMLYPVDIHRGGGGGRGEGGKGGLVLVHYYILVNCADASTAPVTYTVVPYEHAVWNQGAGGGGLAGCSRPIL